MSIRNVFSESGRLRTGWRLAIFLLVSFPPLYVLTRLWWEELLLRYFIIFWLLLIISFLSARFLDRRPIGTIGFLFHSRWLREFIQGLLIGSIAVTILFALEITLGHLDITARAISPSLLFSVFVVSALKTLFQSAFEELFFRGYAFQALIECTNALVATVVISCLFGLGHLLTPNASWIVATNLAVFGAMHAIGYIRTKSLFLPSGMHFGWNFFMRHIYSLPVSGAGGSDTLLSAEVSGPTWITGGEYGPEAGIPAVVVMVAASCLIYGFPGIRLAAEMKYLWAAYEAGSTDSQPRRL